MVNRRRGWIVVALAFGSFALLQGCSADTGDGESEASVNPSVSEALTMPPCGTVLGTFDGTQARSNAGDTSTGYSCAGSGTYGLQYQCVELVQRHFKTHWNVSWHGNAKDLLANAPKTLVDVRYNGDGAHPPVPGDMIVWPNGAYGHVALVTAVHSSSIDILEQNVKGDGHATLSWNGATIGARWGSWVPSGWAHAKANGASPIPSPNPPPPSPNPPPPAGWDCSKSSYQGNQYWTCSASTRNRCQNGVPQTETCANGCQSNPVGTDDTCKNAAPPPPVVWDCNKSSYQGNQLWTCSGSARYRCVSGVPQKETCANSCKSNPLGTNDVCL